MTSALLRSDALRLPLADGTVDLVITSPPFLNLRSYRDGGEHYAGQIGTGGQAEFLGALWAATAEMARVLKPSGSIFVELGDSYGEKCLNLSPERYRIGCVDRLGLVARAVICWSRPNGLPESVTDRVRRSHSEWVHLTKEPRYYSAVDEIREAYEERWAANHRPGNQNGHKVGAVVQPGDTRERRNDALVGERREPNPLGKLPGSVWTVATEPLRVPDWVGVDHFACVDDQTEILSDRGWLTHDQLEVGDTVAGYNLDTGLAQWTSCHAVHRYDYDGELVAVDKRDLSMRLTPNHRCVVRRNGRESIVHADELRSTDAVPRSTGWTDDHHQGIGEALAALCGWVAAEGWYSQSGDGVFLSQSHTANPDHVAAIDKIIAGIPEIKRDAKLRGVSYERGRYRARLKHDGTRRNLGHFGTEAEAIAVLAAERARLGVDGLHRTERVRYWRGQPWTDVMWRLPRGLGQRIRELMPDKTLTAELANLPTHEARALFDAFVDGDGHRRLAHLCSPGRISIYQKYRENLDWLQMVAVRLGYRTILTEDKDRYVLYCNETRRPLTLRGTNGTTGPIPRRHYKGVVWCPTTGTGTMICRRDGRVFITGQSFPTEWPRRLILGWSPSGVCVECGEGRRPVVEKESTESQRDSYASASWTAGSGHLRDGTSAGLRERSRRAEVTVTGEACGCPAPDAQTRPAVVLDPFVGTGTVPMVARALGRYGVGVDLSADYLRLARWRVFESGNAAKAVARTWRERQGGLFDGDTAA